MNIDQEKIRTSYWKEAGEVFKMLKQKPKPKYPTNPNALLELPRDSELIMSIVACIRCKKVLDPNMYFICKANGHLICWYCVETTRQPVSSSSASSPQLKPAAGPSSSSSSTPTDDCCAPENLVKGPARLMDVLLKNSMWTCKYKEQGCQTTVKGTDWEGHVSSCQFDNRPLCKFVNCDLKFERPPDALGHYVLKHGLRPEEPLEDIAVPFEKLGEGCVITLITWNRSYYLFACEIYMDAVYAWVWDVKTISYKNVALPAYRLTTKRVVREGEDRIPSLYRFDGRVLPYTKKSQEIIAEADCAYIALETFKSRNLTRTASNPEGSWILQLEFH